ncbi:MAG: hypothetical protein ACO1SV_01925 [Fimbriimonas sp.]
MPICTRCGAASPEGVDLCQNCGVAFSHQIRARGDNTRARNFAIVRGISWIAAIAVLVLVGPSVYKVGYGGFLKWRLSNAKQRAMKSCGGPALAETPEYKRAEIFKCLETNEELVQVRAAIAQFNK